MSLQSLAGPLRGLSEATLMHLGTAEFLIGAVLMGVLALYLAGRGKPADLTRHRKR